MKSKTNILLFCLLFVLYSCVSKQENIIEQNSIEVHKNELSRTERIQNYKDKLDSVNLFLEWKETDFELWKSKNGDLGLKTQGGTDEGIFITKYIRQLADYRPLNEVIDTLTFKYIGSSFYKDKNNIYTHYEMAYGGNFWIVEDADTESFEVIGDCYAKDKNFIFVERAMKMDSVDYKTFKTCLGCGCFAKDKNGYYFWDEKMDKNDFLNTEETLEIYKKLQKL